MKHYILKGKELVACELLEWARWFETAERRVAFTQLPGVDISTVFLGIDHRHGDGPPLVFETMVFGGTLDQEIRRYGTWDEAAAGHADTVKRLLAMN
jgi:hypothetical protein